MRSAVLIALKDLRLEWRTLESFSAGAIFSLIVLIVFNFAFDLGVVRELGADRLVPGVIWIALAFSSLVGLTRSFQFERQHGAMTALFLAPIDRGAVFAGKAAANVIKLGSLQLLVVPLSALFFDFDLTAIALPLLGVIVLHGIGLVELGTLFAGITSRVGRGEALLATLLFPATCPLLISAVKTTAALLAGQSLAEHGHWLATAATFDLLYLFVGLLTFEFVLEE